MRNRQIDGIIMTENTKVSFFEPFSSKGMCLVYCCSEFGRKKNAYEKLQQLLQHRGGKNQSKPSRIMRFLCQQRQTC